jgi:predicted transcriptional regulator
METAATLIRKLPRHRLVSLMRERGLTQVSVAKWAGVSPFYVNWTIARKYTKGPKVEAVWRELIKRLA